MKKWSLLWLPVLLVAGGIFYSSSQPYEKQTIRPELNHYVDMKKVEKTFETTKTNYAGSEISVQNLGADGFLEFFIRKAAHFIVFFLLSFFLIRALILSGYSIGKAFFASLFAAALFAAADEVHQLFTGNRTPHVADVWLDITGCMGGVLTGILRYMKQENDTKNANS